MSFEAFKPNRAVSTSVSFLSFFFWELKLEMRNENNFQYKRLSTSEKEHQLAIELPNWTFMEVLPHISYIPQSLTGFHFTLSHSKRLKPYKL